MFKFRALQAYIAPHIRCYAAKTTKPVGDTNQALMNALQESQRRLTAIQPVKNEIEQSKSTAVTKSKPLLKDITHIVKKETRDSSVALANVDYVKLKLNEYHLQTVPQPKFQDVSNEYRVKLEQWRDRSKILSKAFKGHLDELIQVFTQKSNAPLAHLGHSVFNSTINEYLLQNLPVNDVGELVYALEFFITDNLLTQFAEATDMGKLYRLSDPIEKMGPEAATALVGALYLRDEQLARDFIRSAYIPKATRTITRMDKPDYLNKLEKIFAKRFKTLPEFRGIEEEDSWFVCSLYAQSELVSMGYGTTYEMAKLNATKSALCVL